MIDQLDNLFADYVPAEVPAYTPEWPDTPRFSAREIDQMYSFNAAGPLDLSGAEEDESEGN